MHRFDPWLADVWREYDLSDTSSSKKNKIAFYTYHRPLYRSKLPAKMFFLKWFSLVKFVQMLCKICPTIGWVKENEEAIPTWKHIALRNRWDCFLQMMFLLLCFIYNP